MTKTEYVSIALGAFAVACIITAMTAFANNDGISTDLASKLIAPVQLFHESAPTEVLIEVQGFEFSEDDAINIVLVLSAFSASLGILFCILAARRRQFSPAQGVAFLFCTAAFVLGFFEFRHIIANA